MTVTNFKTSYVAIKLISGQGVNFVLSNFKTSYVAIKQDLQTVQVLLIYISKHHMLLLNLKDTC